MSYLREDKRVIHTFTDPLGKKILSGVILIFFMMMSSSAAVSFAEGSILSAILVSIIVFFSLFILIRIFKIRLEVYGDNTFARYEIFSSKTYQISSFSGYERKFVANPETFENESKGSYLLLNREYEVQLELSEYYLSNEEYCEWVENTWPDHTGAWFEKQKNEIIAREGIGFEEKMRNLSRYSNLFIRATDLFLCLVIVGLFFFMKDIGVFSSRIYWTAFVVLCISMLVGGFVLSWKQQKYKYIQKRQIARMGITLGGYGIALGTLFLFYSLEIIPTLYYTSPLVFIIWIIIICCSMFYSITTYSKKEKQLYLRLRHGREDLSVVSSFIVTLIIVPLISCCPLLLANCVLDYASPTPRPITVERIVGNSSVCKFIIPKVGSTQKYSTATSCDSLDKRDSKIVFAVCSGFLSVEWICGVYSNSEILPLIYSG